MLHVTADKLSKWPVQPRCRKCSRAGRCGTTGAVELDRGSKDHLQEVPTTTYSKAATALHRPPRQLVDNLLLLQLH